MLLYICKLIFCIGTVASKTHKLEDDDFDEDDDDYYDDNDRPVNIKVNRPFIVLIAICDLILFTARISDPLT